MLKNLLLMGCVIFGQSLSAQKFSGFYIEPTVGTKINMTKKSNLIVPLVTEYFIIKQTQIIGPNSLEIGLNIGYAFKNNDKLQFGVQQDGSSQGYKATALSLVSSAPGERLLGNAISGGYGGAAYSNFSLVYKRSLLHIQSNWLRPNRFLRVHFNIGLSYIYKPNNGVENLTGTDGLSFFAPDSSRVSIAATVYVVPMSFKRSFKFNFGMDFTFGKNDREWCNFNISFISNRSQHAFFSYTHIQASVENKNGITNYGTSIYGTGNGLYFTLSKRIYPVKIYRRRMDKKIEKYNQLKG